MKTKHQPEALSILVIDVGGSHVKCLASGQKKRRKLKSGPQLTPLQMVQGALELTADWTFDVVTIGYPGVVRHGAPTKEPHHLGQGWVGFDFEAAFARPVRIINDAAMQALGSYRGGKMLFLGLGTGLGSALIADNVVVPMELGHLRQGKKHDYEYLLGRKGFKRLGKKHWRRKVLSAVQGLSDALLPDDLVLGGGQADELKKLPTGARTCDNSAAFAGGFRLWAASPSAAALTSGARP